MAELAAFSKDPKTTVAQMKKHAKENKIDLGGATLKADIVAAIKANKPAADFTLSRVLQVMRPLMKGEDVKAAQEALIASGYHVGANGADGIYTASTAHAVRHFQAANGFIVNGKVGSQTATALGAEWKGR